MNVSLIQYLWYATYTCSICCHINSVLKIRQQDRRTNVNPCSWCAYHHLKCVYMYIWYLDIYLLNAIYIYMYTSTYIYIYEMLYMHACVGFKGYHFPSSLWPGIKMTTHLTEQMWWYQDDKGTVSIPKVKTQLPREKKGPATDSYHQTQVNVIEMVKLGYVRLG